MIEKTYVNCGGIDKDYDEKELDELFCSALSNAISDIKTSGKVIILPPDITRFHSKAGFFTEIASRQLADRLGAVLPALGTHMAMDETEIKRMFGCTPIEKFLVHDWREGITELGRIEAGWVEKASEGAVKYDWPIQVNKILRKDGPDSGNFSLALSIGQVVPHEVAGMANHGKNLFVGTGGKEAIDKSHFTGAAFGMEKIMGRADTPVRALFDEGLRRSVNDIPPILWILTVIGARSESEAAAKGKQKGSLAVRGLYIGFGRECFEQASLLSQQVNVNIMDETVNKAVVYLEPEEFRTTWLGNKAVYRTRMVIADGGELIILAPALERFGEDLGIDALIRKHGYRPAKEILSKASTDAELGGNLSAAAHLIHGSSENRFTIRYCPGDKISRQEIESVGFEWGNLKDMQVKYDINTLNSGWNTVEGEKIFYVPNPALGLWAEKKRFN